MNCRNWLGHLWRIRVAGAYRLYRCTRCGESACVERPLGRYFNTREVG